MNAPFDRNWIGLSIFALTVLGAGYLASTRSSDNPERLPWHVRHLARYAVVERHPGETSHEYAPDHIYYTKVWETLHIVPSGYGGYAPTYLAFDIVGPEEQADRQRIVEYLNSSPEHARELLFSPSRSVQYATWATIDATDRDHKQKPLADHVLIELGTMAGWHDPFEAGFALETLTRSKRWFREPFEKALGHACAQTRVDAASYFLDSLDRLDAAQVVDALDLLQRRTTESDVVVQDHCEWAILKGAERLAQLLDAADPSADAPGRHMAVIKAEFDRIEPDRLSVVDWQDAKARRVERLHKLIEDVQR